MHNSWRQPSSSSRQNRRSVVWRYLQSVLLVLAALAISIPVHYVIEPVNLVMLFLGAVVLAAAFLGRGPAILASVLSVLSFDYFLVEPRLSLTVADSQYLLTFFGLLLVGVVISTIVARLRSQVEVIRQREAHAEALSSLSRDLTGVVNLDEMLRSVVQHVHQSVGSRVIVLLPGENGLRPAADSSAAAAGEDNRHREMLPVLEPVEMEIAGQVYRRGVPAPNGDEDESRFQYLLLRTSLGPVGVLGVDRGPGGRLLVSEAERSLLQGFANLTALAIERARLSEQASQAQVLMNIERLQTALLNSISHELRTPLVSITGALSALAEAPDLADRPAENAARQELVETAYEEARRMNLLVGNLLDMSRLESGALRLRLEPCDPQDLIGITLDRFGQRRRDSLVRTSLEDNLPLMEVDVSLMVEVLVNLLENAAKYSPRNSPIDLACSRKDGMIEITVSDRGAGVPSEDLARIFDKFYRSSQVRNTAGLGLGLSISKGIVEAHGGQIQARNREGGGLSMVIHLQGSNGEEPE